MAYVRSFVGHAVAEQPKSSCLQVLCQSPEPEGSATKSSVIPDARFDEISKQLEIDVQKSEWTSRPRTYFILWQIRRVDAMDAFVAAGLNDTSLPYRSRHLLPSALDVNEAERFLQWQNSVVSDTLHLEQGKHVRLNDGDLLFESERRKLGIGSQGYFKTSIVDQSSANLCLFYTNEQWQPLV